MIDLQKPQVSPALSREPSSDDGSEGLAVVMKGHVKCKEEGFGGFMWKNKYCILRESRLDFHKSEQGKVTLSIKLKDVTSCQRSETLPLAFEINRVSNPKDAVEGVLTRDLPQKSMICQVKSDDVIYNWVDNIYSRCPGIGGISAPSQFSHRVHVGFDPTNGSFVGLPAEWEKLLTASAITKEDYQKNPQAVIEVLEFYSDISKRAEQPEAYPSLTPTPPVYTDQNMQLGHGGGGTSIAGPREVPRTGLAKFDASHRAQSRWEVPQLASSPARSQNGTPVESQRKVAAPEQKPEQKPEPKPEQKAEPKPEQKKEQVPRQIPRQLQDPNQSKILMDAETRRKMDEEAHRVQQMRDQRERDRAKDMEDQQRRNDQDTYNATLPKTRTPIAKQEIGGSFWSGNYAPSDPGSASRFNPTRTAPPAPGIERSRQQPPGSLRQVVPQRQAPPPPSVQNASPESAPRASVFRNNSSSQQPSPVNGEGSLRTPPRVEQQYQRQHSPSSRQSPSSHERNPNSRDHKQGPSDRFQSPQTRGPTGGQTNGTSSAPPRLHAPSQPKPLNINTKQPTGAPTVTNGTASEGVKQAEGSSSKKGPAEARHKEVRMSAMTESEVMEKLKQVVSKDNPSESYSKQKKIGQGASGSVYVAKVRETATSAVARQVYRDQGPKGQVAIKQMDLRHQPRKELIVNEIIVMKESHHPNIVNFLDSFLQEENNELWVVMEFMEGGALTDVIDNNPIITEDQIATICHEVSKLKRYRDDDTDLCGRLVKVWHTCTARILSTATSRATMSFWTVVVT